MMKFKLILFLFANWFLSSGQTQDIQKSNSDIKIYSCKHVLVFADNEDKNEIWWLLYKIDWNKRTIQYAEFEFKNGDQTPDLANVRKLFKNRDIDNFIVLSSAKIKVKREKARRERAWLDFATPGVRTPSRPARKYFINGDTITGKNKDLKFVFDKDLTIRYNKNL